MKGKSMKRRLSRVFKDGTTWMREYYNPRTQRKEVQTSPCQNGMSIKRRT